MAFNLIITGLSPEASERKIQSIKAVRAIFRVINQGPLGLREAKALVDNAQVSVEGLVLSTIDARGAEAAAAYLAVYGVQARVEEPVIAVRQSAVTEAVRVLEMYGRYEEADALAGVTRVSA